jgi:uncharacterized protein (TIGR03435 family)
MMRRWIACFLVGIAAAGAGRGQSFEVASVRLNRSGARSGTMEFPPGHERFTMTNMPLGALILTAYDITVRQLAGADLLVSERYDIAAKAERPATRDEMRAMLRRLLMERFRLAVRRETREIPVYALTVAKGGPKLQPGSAPEKDRRTPLVPAHAGGSEAGTGNYVFRNESMPEFAWALSRMWATGDRVVVDQTALEGVYDFELKFSREGGDGPTLFEALPQQLGLKLESSKAPVELVVIEHVERPTEN